MKIEIDVDESKLSPEVLEALKKSEGNCQEVRYAMSDSFYEFIGHRAQGNPEAYTQIQERNSGEAWDEEYRAQKLFRNKIRLGLTKLLWDTVLNGSKVSVSFKANKKTECSMCMKEKHENCSNYNETEEDCCCGRLEKK